MTQLQNTGILTIGGIGRSAKESGKSSCKSVTKKSSVKSWISQIIFSNGCRDGRHITYRFHHGCASDRSHNKDCCYIEFTDLDRWDTYQSCGCDRCKIKNRRSIRISQTNCIHDHSHCIRDHNSHEDRDDLEHAFTPDIEYDNHGQGYKCKEPVGGSISDGRGCKA